MSGSGWDTDRLVTSAWKQLRKSRIDGRAVSKSNVEDVWEKVGPYIKESLRAGKAVALAKFGTFTFAASSSSSMSTSGSSNWALILASDFTRGCAVRQRQGGLKPKTSAATRLNFVGLAQFSRQSKELCRKVLDAMLWNVTFALTKNASWLELDFPGLGRFSCRGGACDFVFGDVLPEDSQSDYSASASEEEEDEDDDEDDEDDDDYHDEDDEPQPRVVRRMVIPASLERLREKVKKRGGVNGIHSLGRVLRIMDDSGDGFLSRDEFRYGLQDFGVSINSAELEELFSYLDRDRNGKISFDELLVGLRGPLSKRRLDLIHIAFKRLDHTGDGVVTIEDLEAHYNAAADADVQAGRASSAEALRNMLAQFDTIDQDGVVTQEEFEEYYKNVSASIDKDDYFELMMRNAWHISGGKGQTANTSNRRVLVTHEDGSQTVEEVEDDLFVKKTDQAEMKKRLAKRGVHAQGNLGMHHAVKDDLKKPTRTRGARGANSGANSGAKLRTKAARAQSPRFRASAGPGDESLPGAGGEDGEDGEGGEDGEEGPGDPEKKPMAKLGKLLQQKRMSADDFLLKIGANRVFGNASIEVGVFVRGLVRFAGAALSKEEAEAIAREADADRSGSIDVPELCAQLGGASAVERIKAAVIQRGGMNGIASLSRVLRLMDESGDGSLDRREVMEGFATFKVKLTSHDVEAVFAYFDKDRNGKLSVTEFLVGLRGELNARRTALVLTAFGRMDRSGDGVITVEDMQDAYDPTFHPDYKAGSKSKTQVLRELLDVFDGADKDGVVTEAEFLDYYKALSASIDKDDYFELMMRNAWHISGGEGQCANTSNRRVLVTDSQGRQSVREVKDDLFVKKDDARRRLGLAKDDKIDYAYGSKDLDKASKQRQHKHNNSTRTAKATTKTKSKSKETRTQRMRRKAEEAEASKRPAATLMRKLGPSSSKGTLAWGAPEAGGDESFARGGPDGESGTDSDDSSDDEAAEAARSQRPRQRGAGPPGRFSRAPSGSGGSRQRGAQPPRSSPRGRKQPQKKKKTQVERPRALDRLRERVVARGGSNGIHTLGRVLKIMDDSGDKCLDREELRGGLQDYGVEASSAEVDAMFEFLDQDRSGKVSFDEFLRGMRGPLPKRRVELILLAFKRLDRTGDGVVTVEDLELSYDTSFHPDVRSGRLTKAQALRELLDQFDGADKDGVVTDDEFIEYYKNVSASIDGDDYFELMMRNAWHISGGKGQTANTSNRRVLVTHKDGRQTVEEVEDDLFVGKNDQAEMKKRLAKRGVHAQGGLGMYHAAKDDDKNSKARQPKAKQSTISLAWDEDARVETQVKTSRQRERKIRQGAAARVQALARANMAKKSVGSALRNKRHSDAKLKQIEQERQRLANRIIRPAGESWY